MRKLCWVMTLVALLAGQGTPALAEDYDACEEPVCKPLGNIVVDFISFRRRFTNPDLAFTTTNAIPGVAPAGNVLFDQANNIVPRINLQMFLSSEWSISSSFFRMPSFDQSFGLSNATSSGLITSASFPYGPTSINSSIVGATFAGPLFVTVPLNRFVSSQAPFYFVPLLPTRTLFNDPNGGKAAGSLIGATFEYTSNAAAGFPDILGIQTHFAMEQADMNLNRTWDTGFAIAGVGLGLQYVSISHAYTVTRDNAGGPLATRYDPQDGDTDLNSVDPASRFEDGPDFDHFRYTSRFQGVGPKIGLTGTWPPIGPLQLYARAAGAVVLGTRNELLLIDNVQNGTFVNQDSASERSGFANAGRLIYSRSLTGQFGRSKFLGMPEGEAEAGLTLHLGFGGIVDPILKIGGIVQYWRSAGNSSNPTTGLLLYGGMASVGIAF